MYIILLLQNFIINHRFLRKKIYSFEINEILKLIVDTQNYYYI